MRKSNLIIILDDDDDDRQMLSAAFTDNYDNTSVLLFERTSDFIQYIESGATLPSFIITDLYMAGITGLDIIETLKMNADTGQIPIAIMSTTMNDTVQKAALDMGAVDYFVKPSSLAEFSLIADSIMAKI